MMVQLEDFFFFKQKTAYEVRISDWSSDVCSSDLVLVFNTGPQGAPQIWGPGLHRLRCTIPGDLFNDGTYRLTLQVIEGVDCVLDVPQVLTLTVLDSSEDRSEERRVGKEWFRTCRSRWSPYQ